MTYKTAIPLGTLAASRIAAMDIDKDGLAEVAVSTNSSPVKIYKLSITGGTCAFGSSNDCVVNDAIWDLKGFSVDPASNTGTFIAVRNNSSANAFSTCTGIPVVAKTQTDAKFSGQSPRREATVPPLKSPTSGIFTLFEKSNDATGGQT
jgi:formylmethanofuran dehydrogenase subunit A